MSYRSQSPSHYELGPHVNYTWTAGFNLSSPAGHDAIMTQLGSIAQQFNNPVYGISGALRGGRYFSSSVLLTLDPSQTYATPSIAACEEIACAITEIPGWTRSESTRIPEHRIIMGRREGYDDKARQHSYEEALGLARVCLSGERTSTEQAELFSVRHIPGEGLRTNHEPAMIIEGGIAMLNGALQLAHEMRQTRVVSEVADVITQVYQRRQQ